MFERSALSCHLSRQHSAVGDQLLVLEEFCCLGHRLNPQDLYCNWIPAPTGTRRAVLSAEWLVRQVRLNADC